MCGIVGAIAERDIVPILIEGLRRLEYRGYDSAGLALIESLLPAHTSGLDCLLLDQLALADGLLASAPGLPAVPSTHRAPVGLVQHGWVLHRALFQARTPPAALRA